MTNINQFDVVAAGHRVAVGTPVTSLWRGTAVPAHASLTARTSAYLVSSAADAASFKRITPQVASPDSSPPV